MLATTTVFPILSIYVARVHSLRRKSTLALRQRKIALLRHLADVSVHCWGSPRDEPGVTAYEPWAELKEPKPESTALQSMSITFFGSPLNSSQ